MDSRYLESRPILPRMLTYIMAAVLMSTVAFMVFSEYILRTDMPSWAIPVVAAVFVIIIVASYMMRFTVNVGDDAIEIRYAVKKMRIPLDEVIDSRVGELALIRNYDRWSLKGVKHKAYMAIGEDDGVALKLTGKRVLVLSSTDAESLYAAVPKDEATE